MESGQFFRAGDLLLLLSASSSKAGGAQRRPLQWEIQIQDWRDNLRQKYQIPVQARPWTQCPEFQCTGFAQNPRVLSILDAVACEVLGKQNLSKSWNEKRQLLKHVYVDLSQNPCRRSFTQGGLAPSLRTSTLMYSFFRDGEILPIELMYMQGHRRLFQVGDLPAQDLRALAGEGMSLPELGSVLWSAYLLLCLDPSGSSWPKMTLG